MERKTLLFPSSYFSINRVDEDMQAEYDSAIATGLFDIVLFSYDKWFNEGKLRLNCKPQKPVCAVYRGWMMKPETYSEFYWKLTENNIRLITSVKEYELLHMFPNIYPAFSSDTAKMLVYPDGKADLDEIRKNFNYFMVKDYVKSVKGTAFPKFFESTVSQEEFDSKMEIFYKYRSNLYTGGICIKEYLDLKKYKDHTNEYRAFYFNGEILSVSQNSAQEISCPQPPEDMINKYKSLGSPFYTIDYAETSDGCWKVIEAGDGQVSGLSENQDYDAFFRAIFYGLDKIQEI